jgi:hypothetical protein
MVMVAHPSVPAKTVAELIVHAKARAGDISNNALAQLGLGAMSHLSPLATFRRKIDVFGIAVNGADKAEPAQDIGRDVKISDGLLQAARGRRLAFPSRGRC